jgi:hypothetical protein
MPLGPDLGYRRPATSAPVGLTPTQALAHVMLPALQRPPALIAFSGGRDSSLLLAVAMKAARRHGLPPPVPVTYRNPAVRDVDETDWQEAVVAHLGVQDWVRVKDADQLDFLGPLALTALRRHGVRYPPNAHFLSLIAPHAAGGTLILGIGGDELFSTWRWTARADVLAGRVRPSRRNVGTLVLGALPGRPRRTIIRRRPRLLDVPWVTDATRIRLNRMIDDEETQPTRWDEFVLSLLSRRRLTVTLETLRSLAADSGAELLVPFVAEPFLRALADAGGRDGWGDRARVMQAIGAEVLPSRTIRRSSKAVFDDVYWGPRSRAFAQRWRAAGGAHELINPNALREEWLSPRPHVHTAVLLQASHLDETVVKDAHE